jgi:hypothetical protein
LESLSGFILAKLLGGGLFLHAGSALPWIGTTAQSTGIALLEKEVARGSDRAVAIIAGSLVEGQLKQFLINNTQDTGKLWENLSRVSGPLGSFSVKIDIAYMFRLISETAHADLTIMKDVRNKFAHKFDIEDFESQSIRNKSMNLRLVDRHVIYVDQGGYLNGDPIQVGSRTALEEIKAARGRYIWTAKIFMLAFALGRSSGPQI